MLGHLLKSLFGTRTGNGDPSADAAALPASRSTLNIPSHTGDAYRGKRIISLVSGSGSDGLAAGAYAMADICRAEGYDFRLVDLRNDGWNEELNALISQPEEVCCIYSLMGLGADWETNTIDGTQSLWRESGIPFISAIGDHPAYFWDRHISRGRGFSTLYVFDEHYDAALAWLEPRPLAGMLPPWPRDTVDKQDLDFAAKKSGKIYFFKNGNDPRALMQFWRTLPKPMCEWLPEIAHSVDMHKLGRGMEPLHELVARYLRDRRFFAGPPSWIQVFMVAQLDDYARRLKSTLMAEALLDLPVHIFGANWGHVDFTGRRATHSEGQSYFSTRSLINDALGVIDMSPNTESAPHERFMTAIGRYTLCLNNTQKYYLENYSDAQDMLFDFDMESVKSTVADVLAEPGHYVDYGVAIAEHARRIHPPGKVVESLVNFANMTRFAGASTAFAGQQNFIVWPVVDE